MELSGPMEELAEALVHRAGEETEVASATRKALVDILGELGEARLEGREEEAARAPRSVADTRASSAAATSSAGTLEGRRDRSCQMRYARVRFPSPSRSTSVSVIGCERRGSPSRAHTQTQMWGLRPALKTTSTRRTRCASPPPRLRGHCCCR